MLLIQNAIIRRHSPAILLLDFSTGKPMQQFVATDGKAPATVAGTAMTKGKNHGGYGLDPRGMQRGAETVLLLAEHAHDTPLGIVDTLTQSDDDVAFAAHFVPPEGEATAWHARYADAMARYMQGLLPAVSVGFVPDFASFDDSEGFPIFRQWSLVEVSLVAAGLDSGAVSQHAPAVTAPLGAPLLIRSPFRSK